MEKKKGPPPEDFPGPMEPPPYPGPPMDQSVLINQPSAAAQPAPQSVAQFTPGPSSQPVPQQHPQQYPQQHPQQYLQQPPQQYPQQPPQQYLQQPPQQYPQQPPQQYPQQTLQQYPQQIGPQVVQPMAITNITQQSQVAHPVVIIDGKPTDAPGQMFCPTCQNTVVTNTNPKVGLLTWIICGVMAVLIIWPCCLIPFCVNSCKDVEHSCPNCHKVLHIYSRR